MTTAIFTLKEHGQEDKTYRPTQKTIEKIFAEADEYGDSRFTSLLDYAIKHWYGKNKFFWRDNGLKDQGIFGQVCEPLPEKLGGGNNCVTSRIYVSMDVNGHDVCNGPDLERALKEEK